MDEKYTLRITAAPFRSIGAPILCNLENIGFAFEALSLGRVSLASRARIAASSETIEETVELLDAAFLDDRARLLCNTEAWKSLWFYDSVLFSVVHAFQHCNTFCCTVIYKGKGTQAWIIRMIRKRENDKVAIEAVETRLKRSRKDKQLQTASLKQRIAKLGGCTKSWAICTSILRILTHGICSGRRFQDHDCRWRFGCGHSPDDLCHFWVCPRLCHAVGRCIRKLGWDTNLS